MIILRSRSFLLESNTKCRQRRTTINDDEIERDESDRTFIHTKFFAEYSEKETISVEWRGGAIEGERGEGKEKELERMHTKKGKMETPPIFDSRRKGELWTMRK